MAAHHVIGMGGTFDHFHAGHRHFIQFAATHADRLLIGITAPEMTHAKSWPQTIQSYDERAAAVADYCHQAGIEVELVRLTDQYGPTLADSHVDALCVTTDSAKGGEAINRRRQQLGLPALPIYTCSMWPDQLGQPLHADQIRAGLADRTGHHYFTHFHKDVIFTDEQKSHFSQPPAGAVNISERGPLDSPGPIVVVGDTSLETFITKGWPYHLGVFDRRRHRQPWESTVIDQLPIVAAVENPAGQISVELSRELHHTLHAWHHGRWHPANHPLHLYIEGEEDLVAVILALVLPLGSQLCYGQPNQALMSLIVTESLKQTFDQLFAHDRTTRHPLAPSHS